MIATARPRARAYELAAECFRLLDPRFERFARRFEEQLQAENPKGVRVVQLNAWEQVMLKSVGPVAWPEIRAARRRIQAQLAE